MLPCRSSGVRGFRAPAPRSPGWCHTSILHCECSPFVSVACWASNRQALLWFRYRCVLTAKVVAPSVLEAPTHTCYGSRAPDSLDHRGLQELEAGQGHHHPLHDSGSQLATGRATPSWAVAVEGRPQVLLLPLYSRDPAQSLPPCPRQKRDLNRGCTVCSKYLWLLRVFLLEDGHRALSSSPLFNTSRRGVHKCAQACIRIAIRWTGEDFFLSRISGMM